VTVEADLELEHALQAIGLQVRAGMLEARNA
jgi:hypothetical protein